jgi:hypothetical protein
MYLIIFLKGVKYMYSEKRNLFNKALPNRYKKRIKVFIFISSVYESPLESNIGKTKDDEILLCV